MNGFSLWRYEMRAAAKRPAPLFLSIILPLVILGLVFLVLQGFVEEGREPVEAAVVDEDDTFQTNALINQLSAEERLSQALNLIPMDEEQAEAAFENGELAGVMTIPEGFTASLMNGENDPIDVMTSADDPLDATMLEVLLDSGANYISASQSAVNTVYDLHIRDLPQDERSSRLQETIITYTLFALDRGDLFSEETVTTGASIGWEKHAYLAALITFLFLFLVMYQMLDGKKADGSMVMRWRMVDVTFVHWTVVKQLKWGLMTLAVLELLVWVVGRTDAAFTSSLTLHLSLLFTAVWVSAFAGFLYSMQVPPGLRFLFFFVVTIVGLLSAGAWVPSLYLPEWLSVEWSPYQLTYDGLRAGMLDEDERGHLFGLALWGVGLTSLSILIALGKEKRDAYISILTSE
ncbi:ABC transporter permease [Halobacillus litoralis]|uniref:ABC transporter permease n=1 Tax=Halobacillus litoralis TaxID=45668 RepID=UPI001CD7DE4C|nr:ABC transporter permease [Halobacillus litoralis]MCA0970689.1 ABC transporter permease [Halobacillus litoralis]